MRTTATGNEHVPEPAKESTKSFGREEERLPEDRSTGVQGHGTDKVRQQN